MTMLSKTQQDIAQYVTLDHKGENLRIRFDHLAMRLLDDKGPYKLYFKPSIFEERLLAEIKGKILGKPFGEAQMAALCDYIVGLARYLTSEYRKELLDVNNASELVQARQKLREKNGVNEEYLESLRHKWASGRGR